VSFGKVFVGLAGVAVVVILIAVPTALHLRGESAIHVTRRDRWIVRVPRYLFFLSPPQEEKSAFDYQVSADRKYVAFMSNYSKLWRHSFTASYSLYDMKTDQFLTSDIPNEVQYFAWAPEGNKLAYVWGHNVYIKSSPTSPPQQVTFNGKMNEIFNGIPDWVYEEEMFSSNQGLWWSPGGKYVAYVETNDTMVHTIEYSWYGSNQYPSTVSIPYPKPGTPNPVVKLFVVDTDNVRDITEVVVPASFGSSEHYLATVTWVKDGRIAVQWLKRVQQHLMLQIYSLNGSKWDPETDVRLEVTSSHGWIGRVSMPGGFPVFTNKTVSCFISIKSKNSNKNHFCANPAQSPLSGFIMQDKPTPVTWGEWEVINILKVTEDAVYYSSNEEGGKPGGRNVYKLAGDGTKKCLTCALLGDRCHYNSAYFSHNASFYQMSCRGGRFGRMSSAGFCIFVEVQLLEDNTDFSSTIADIRMPTMRREYIELHGFKLWYQMFLPPGFDESKKYPLLIDVYAGPCSQNVDFMYQVSYSTYLASTENIIVASFDGRGSGYQGDKLMHAIYKRLGTYEVEDQITAAREFIKMGFIDKDRVAIWGWSYGGYVTSMALGSGSGVFKCGMAIAPVSKWEYYDTIYTERYMMPPEDNYDAYMNSTVTGRAKNFHSVQYLLVHGTADDNVHFQQAAEISEALVEEQVDFEAMWYTDKDHGLGGSAYQHVYTHMSHFLLRCFV
uniref:Uncharacterized protein n=1 Tax=Mola mola TaxID=94237 RepID=A0A3Q3WAU1_MOLML